MGGSNKWMWTALHVAVGQCLVDCASLLLDAGADPHLVSSCPTPPPPLSTKEVTRVRVATLAGKAHIQRRRGTYTEAAHMQKMRREDGGATAGRAACMGGGASE